MPPAAALWFASSARRQRGDNPASAPFAAAHILLLRRGVLVLEKHGGVLTWNLPFVQAELRHGRFENGRRPLLGGGVCLVAPRELSFGCSKRYLKNGKTSGRFLRNHIGGGVV